MRELPYLFSKFGAGINGLLALAIFSQKEELVEFAFEHGSAARNTGRRECGLQYCAIGFFWTLVKLGDGSIVVDLVCKNLKGCSNSDVYLLQ